VQSTKVSAGRLTDLRSIAGRAPMLSQGGPGSSRFTHTSDRGFCTVCGSVWPCAQAGRSGEDR
jgi:hypothetical protein